MLLLHRPGPVAGPVVVVALSGSPPLDLETSTISRYSPRGSIPPCGKSPLIAWGGRPPQGGVFFGRLLLVGIPPRSQSAPMVVARAVCHPGDRKRRGEFPRRFNDVYSPSRPERPCCWNVEKAKKSLFFRIKFSS